MKKVYLTTILCAFLFGLFSSNLFGQVQFKIELLPDNITYKVSMKPSVTWTPPMNLTSSGQVSVKAPHGGLSVINLTSLVAGTSWANNANYAQPSEAPAMDYINFGLTSTGTSAFTYTAGVEIGLFTFQSSSPCLGAVELLEANDPFLPPNSLNANVGNQLTTFGGGPGVNVWSGNYYNDANCAGSSCDITINGVIASAPSDCGQSNGSISIAATGTGPLEYSINNGATWQSSNTFNGLSGGSYSVKVKNNNCEVAQSGNPVVIVAPAAPTISNVATTATTGCGVPNGAIVVTATGGSGNYEYSINGGATWSAVGSFASLPAGSYVPAVRNGNGTCLVQGAQVTIGGPTTLGISVLPINPTQCNSTDGAISVTASNGTGTYEYSRDGGATWQGASLFTGLAAGNYVVRARNAGGTCSTAFANNPVVLTGPSCLPGNCLIAYQLELLPDGRYLVSMTPDTTWSFPQNVTSSAQVTIVAPTGGFSVTNMQNQIPGVTFAQNATYLAPAENSTKDYYIFGLTSVGTNAIPYQKGAKVALFTFENGTNCTGDPIYLMPVSGDPFAVPNSLSANTGQQLSTLGSGQDAPICIVGTSQSCIPCGPNMPDADADGTCDNQEILDDTDPNDACDPNGSDADDDGICDLQELIDGTDPGNPCDPNPNSAACLAICDDIWTSDTIYVDGSDGNPGVCVPLSASQMGFYDIILDGQPYTQPTTACYYDTLFFYTYAFTVGQGSLGPYIVEYWNVGGQQFSGVVADMNDLAVKMNQWDPNGGWTNNQVLKAVSGGNDGVNYGTMKLRHIATNVPTYINKNLTFVPFGNMVGLSGPGSFEVVLEETVGGCSDTAIVVVVDLEVDEIDLVTEFGDPINDCVETDELPGSITSIALCGQPSHGSVVFTSDTCFTYIPGNGFYGEDNFCVIICNDTDPQFCDTTLVTVTVNDPACPPLFGQDTLLVNGLETDICVPIDNLQLIYTDITLDGAGYNALSSTCGADTLTFYTYAYTFGQGNGNYLVEYWEVGNATFTGLVASMSQLADLMNSWDPNGNWSNNPATFTISGGLNNMNYGALKLRHIASSVPTVIQPNFTVVNGGAKVQVQGEGLHTLMVQNSLTDCADTLVVWLNVVTPDTMYISTMENTPTGVNCLDQSELPGGATTASLCGSPSHGVAGLAGTHCFNYLPATDYVGQDQFCVVICNGTLPQFCDTTYVVVTVNPVKDEIPVIIDPREPDTVCMDQPGPVVQATVCGENVDEVDVTPIPGTDCFILDPADDFGGFTEICVVQCWEGNVNGQLICDTTIIDITVLPPTDTVEIPLITTDSQVVCLDSVLNLPGDVISGEICGFNPAEVAVTVDDEGCVTIDPVNGFNGASEICVIFCNNTVPQLCDTTYIVIDVAVPCDPIFGTPDTIVTYVSQACAPLAFNQWSIYDILLDGVAYTYPPQACDEIELYYYTYAFTIGMGNAGPYTINSWKVNGQTFSGTVANMAALVAQMNIWDPTGNWQLQAASFSISGGSQSNVYDKMIIVHQASGIPTVLLPNYTSVAYGSLVQVGTPGLHQLVAVDPQTGCSDTLYIWYVDTTPETVHVTTPQGTPTAPVCLDLSELQGAPLTPSLCQAPQHGSVAFNNNCLTYSPQAGFAGEEQFCVVICDDNNPQFCDTTYVQVTVLPQSDTVTTTLQPDVPQPVCLGNFLQFQGALTQTSLCGPVPAGVAVTVNNSACISIDPADNFAGNAQICVQHCYLGAITGQPVCDTTIINLTVLPQTDVVDVVLDDQDPTIVCLGQYIELPGTVVNATICGENPAQVDATASTNGCVTLDPAPGFFGTTQICVVFCDNSVPQFCDTTILNVTVDVPCPDVFNGVDTLYSNVPQACAPIAFGDINIYDIILNGASYLFPPQPCNEDSLVFYTYAFTVGSGNSGPYLVQSWNVNGQVFSGMVANMNELAAKMNVWDPTGNWVNNPNSYSVSGGGQNTTYSTMILRHVGTNIPAILLPNYTNVALGTTIQLPGEGCHELVVVNQSTGCTDTLIICVAADQVVLAPRVFLQGAYNTTTGLMRDNLRALGYLPSTEPYSAISTYDHVGGGGETVDPGVFAETGADAIVDWVFVELRDTANSETVVATRSALVQRDGDVVDMDGFSPLTFDMTSGTYHVAIRHRNHLGAMTKYAIPLSNSVAVVDFTSTLLDLYGTDATKVVGNKRLLWAGNANSNDELVFQGDANDTDAVFFQVILAPGNGTFSPNYIFDGYHTGDTNMDGRVIFQGFDNDVDFMIFYNLLTHPQNPAFLINFIFVEQLP